MNGNVKPVIVSATSVALSLTLVACGGPTGPVKGAVAYAHVNKMVAMGPRPAGSENLKRCAEYIKAELTKLDLPAHEQVWEQTVQVYDKERKLTLRNVWTEIPGKDPEGGPILLLAAHYDTKSFYGHPKPEHNFNFVGAIDGGGASGLLLELAAVLKTRDNFPNIWIAWFDREESVEHEWKKGLCLLGSTHFRDTMSADKKRFPYGLSARLKAMVLLDLIGDSNIKIDKDTQSNAELIDIFGLAAEQMGEGDRMYAFESPMEDDHVPFKEFGVAVIDLIDFRWRYDNDQARAGEKPPADGEYAKWWHTDQDTMKHVSADSLAFAGNLVWYALPEIEKRFYGN